MVDGKRALSPYTSPGAGRFGPDGRPSGHRRRQGVAADQRVVSPDSKPSEKSDVVRLRAAARRVAEGGVAHEPLLEARAPSGDRDSQKLLGG